LGTPQTAWQDFDCHASIGSTMGKLTTIKCGDTTEVVRVKYSTYPREKSPNGCGITQHR
jgi:hypothetical protein